MSIIMVQRSASELRVVDYIEDSHKKLSDYVEMLKAKPYNWGQDWLPHDGFSKDYKTGKSAEEMLKAMGRSVSRTPNMDIEGGIKAAREVFERIWFDKEKTVRLVECLKRYRRNIGQKTGEAGAPLHDEFSHGADAFRYLALCADQLKNTDGKPKRRTTSEESTGSWMAG
jgi:phage terminase large subunit